MHNVKTRMENGHLIIDIDTNKKVVESAPKSSSGKNKLVASTGGHVAIPDSNLKLNLTLTHPN